MESQPAQQLQGSAAERNAAPNSTQAITADDIADNDSLEKTSSNAQAMNLAADTASASSGVNESNIDDDDFQDDCDPMPLMNYTRLAGSIPRASSTNIPGEGGSGSTVGPLSERCRCSAMGKVMLDPSELTVSAEGGGGSVSSRLDLMSIRRTSCSGGDVEIPHQMPMIPPVETEIGLRYVLKAKEARSQRILPVANMGILHSLRADLDPKWEWLGI